MEKKKDMELLSMNKKIIFWAFVFLISISSVFALENDTKMQYEACPKTIPSVMMYSFYFIAFFVMLWFSEKIIRVPFVTILIGMGFLVYSFTMYQCNIVLGYVTTTFAVAIMLFKVFWK